MSETLKRNWWLVIAALLGALQLVVTVGIWVDKLTPDKTTVNGVVVELPGEPLLKWEFILLTGVVLLATAALAIGLYMRSHSSDQSRWLIMVGVVPSVLIGLVFFWFPPFWIVSGAAIAVLFQAARDAVTEPVHA